MSDLLPEGSNGVVHGRGAIVALEPVPVEEVDYGNPRQGVLELGKIGGCEAGIWELRDGAVLDTEVDELFVVISGWCHDQAARRGSQRRREDRRCHAVERGHQDAVDREGPYSQGLPRG